MNNHHREQHFYQSGSCLQNPTEPGTSHPLQSNPPQSWKPPVITSIRSCPIASTRVVNSRSATQKSPEFPSMMRLQLDNKVRKAAILMPITPLVSTSASCQCRNLPRTIQSQLWSPCAWIANLLILFCSIISMPLFYGVSCIPCARRWRSPLRGQSYPSSTRTVPYVSHSPSTAVQV